MMALSAAGLLLLCGGLRRRRRRRRRRGLLAGAMLLAAFGGLAPGGSARAAAPSSSSSSSSDEPCAGGISASAVIPASPSGGLRETCPGSASARYIQADPMTGGLLEICGGSGDALALPTSPCGETRIGGLAVLGSRLYYTTGSSLRAMDAATGANDRELLGALGLLRVAGRGFEDVVALRLRGRDCVGTRVESTTQLSCWVTDPACAGPTARPLLATDVQVETRLGGNGTATTPTLAELRAAEYGTAAPPAVFEATFVENYALRAGALSADADTRLLWLASSLGTPRHGNQGFGGLVVVDPETRLVSIALRDPSARIQGIAIREGLVYYSDASRGLVATRPSSSRDGTPGDHAESVLARIDEPRSIAFDPYRPLDVYVSAASNIVRITEESVSSSSSVQGAQNTSTTRTMKHSPSGVVAAAAAEDVVLGPSTAVPDGLVLLPPRDPKNRPLDRDLRLVWLDANRPRLNAATRYGTRQTELGRASDDDVDDGNQVESGPLRFARAIALDEQQPGDAPGSGHSVVCFVAEFLGRIWRFPSLRSKRPVLLRDDTSTAIAPTLRDALEREDLARRRLQPTMLTLFQP